MDDRFELTRRKALAALGTIGAASAGAGLGTSAYFSDQETFENNQLTAGTLDMKVAATEYYSDWSSDEAEYAGMAADAGSTDIRLPPGSGQDDAQAIAIDIDGDNYANFFDALSTDENGTPYNRVNGGVSAATDDGLCGDTPEADADGPVIIDIGDVKPGDFGGAQFAFELCDNPGYVWLTGGLDSASEGGTTEPERDDPDEESGVVELLDEIQVAYGVGPINGGTSAFEDTDSDDDGFEPVEQYTLREFLATLDGDGIALDGDIDAEVGGGTGEQGCFAGNPDEGSAVHQVSVVWWLPIDHGNQVQSDSVTFDLGFYTEQCRHNPGETDLVAYYPFENSADDLSGNGYDGTLNGGVSYTGGQVGRAASFEDGDVVSVSHDGSLTDVTDFTASAWFRSTADGRQDQVVFGIRNGYEIVFDSAGARTSSDNSIWWAIDNGTGDWAVNDTGAGPLTVGEWHHAALVQDTSNDEVRVYIDGSLVVTDNGTGPVNTTTSDLGIGSRGDGFGQFNGAIDDVRIYSRALSASEIQALYDSA